MNQAQKFGNYAEVSLQSPYLNNSKAAIVGWGGKMGVPMDITWSCYDPQEGNGGQKVHCGLCGTCVERREAFSHAGVTDPTAYKATQ